MGKMKGGSFGGVVAVSVGVGDGVSVSVGVTEAVAVNSVVAVSVGVGDGVSVSVEVAEAVAVNSVVTVSVGVADGVSVSVEVAEGVAVNSVVAVSVKVAAGVLVGSALTVTPNAILDCPPRVSLTKIVIVAGPAFRQTIFKVLSPMLNATFATLASLVVGVTLTASPSGSLMVKGITTVSLTEQVCGST